MSIQKRFLKAEKVIQLEKVGIRYSMPDQKFRSFKAYAIHRMKGRVKKNTFTALQDVSFDVHRGEVVGIIGPNGAGKSTLLRVVARILRPTSGRIYMKGNVAPLLGVGAGFHNELTGRENVFLGGALLGFTRREMEEKFDRIVEFSGIGKFIDAPVRTYSSGMRTRLGFSVATDTTPDVLLIDEVLSVGDEDFRQKSRHRMRNFFKQGATILLVSHNLGTITELCNRVVWLDGGQVQMIDRTRPVVQAYRETRKKQIQQEQEE